MPKSEHLVNQTTPKATPVEKIELIARALIRSDDLVLVCRNLRHGHRYLPGGHVEPGEPAAVALRRELDEEASLGDAVVGACLLVQEQLFTQRDKDRHEFSIVFHVELPRRLAGPAPLIPSRESDIAFEWIRVMDLSASGFRPAALADWLLGNVDLDKACWWNASPNR